MPPHGGGDLHLSGFVHRFECGGLSNERRADSIEARAGSDGAGRDSVVGHEVADETGADTILFGPVPDGARAGPMPDGVVTDEAPAPTGGEGAEVTPVDPPPMNRRYAGLGAPFATSVRRSVTSRAKRFGSGSALPSVRSAWS